MAFDRLLNSMQRILILGNAGAGKSTFARRLAAVSGLPLIHLDAYFWQPGWREPRRDQWAAQVEALTGAQAWIMDGNYAGTLESRLSAADTVIILDVPRLQCIYRVISRGLRERGSSRSDLATGCREQLPDFAFLRWIWRFPKEELTPMLATLKRAGARVRVIRLRSSADIDRLLSEVTLLSKSSGAVSSRPAT